MKHYIFYFSFLLLCIPMHAQTNVGIVVPTRDSTFTAKLTGEFFYESRQYIGMQYFNDNWAQGDILLSTGEMVSNVSLKYNGLFDEVIWMNTSNFGKFKVDKSFIREFWLKYETGTPRHFKRINVSEPDKGLQPDIFVEVAVEGKISLYIQRRIVVSGTQMIYRNDAFRDFETLEASPVYYIKLPSNQYLKMNRIRRRAFLKFFPEKKKAITKILNANNLDIHVESDFVKLIQLMGTELF